MPRLISEHRKPNALPSYGRRIVYVRPHSPFQKLVESHRLGRGMSVRDVAEAVSRITSPFPRLNPGSLWIWLRNQNGFPHPKSCTATRLAALASVLRVPLPRLKEVLDSSRHLYTARERTEPATSLRSIDALIAVLEGDKRTCLSRKRILNLAKALRRRPVARVKI